MKRPERFPPDDPREWMNRARSNLALAKNQVAEAYLEGVIIRYDEANSRVVGLSIVGLRELSPHTP